MSTMRALPRTAPPGSVVIDVVGYQFWWSASYRAEQITVANEIHVPVGERVELRLISADVIHSFWVPRLQGKLDVLPDGPNTLVIEADEPGVYGGECAEFCGLQHANMGVLVVAQRRDEFDAWVAAQQQPAGAPASEAAQRGQQIFEAQDCAQCHTVRGVVTGGHTAPDLTHVASRQTLLSDTVENTRANLTAFLRDPDAVKDGTGMPRPELSESELSDLVAFLEGLQ
jgi:cytochrome c oxidase subunit 2